MTHTPRVSVIMPVYNQAWIAHRAAQSLARQSFRDFEVIVVDDGSTDGLDPHAIAEATGAVNRHWIRRETPGGSAALALNAGVKYAAGELLTWVSGDNLMHPDWLASLVDVFDTSQTAIGAAYGGFTYVLARRRDVDAIAADTRLSVSAVQSHWSCGFRTQYLFERHEPGKQIASEACYYGPAFLMRRAVWTTHEGGASHDLGHWLRCEEECERRGWKIVGVDKNLCWYLAHDERCVIRQPHLYDSPSQLTEARKRRGNR